MALGEWRTSCNLVGAGLWLSLLTEPQGKVEAAFQAPLLPMEGVPVWFQVLESAEGVAGCDPEGL
jgi:hypothetical protein